MAVWMEILLALLAAAGLLAMGWILFGKLVTPAGIHTRVYAVIPASGGGEGLEQAVEGLLWLRGGELARFSIVIADCGLNPQGRAAAAALSLRGAAVCPLESLPACLSAGPSA